MIGDIISHYKILEKLGEGGMGVVYKAEDTKLDRIVALKFLPKHLLRDEEAKTRFVHEAKAASALDHQNIATIYEIDETEEECFISMAYIEGKSIKEVIKEKKLSIEEILGVAIQVCEGLAIAHEKGIVHRDIKSDNIMLTSRGQVKIMDFGLAKLKGVTKLTKAGTTLGTIQYMSPEQAQGIEVDQRSDIFSLGVVLYEMITSQLPFKGEHEAAVIYSIVNETPEPLARYKANVPDGLQRIVDKALEKERETRYQTSDDLAADLEKLKRMIEEGVPFKESRVLVPEPGKRSIAVMYFEDFTEDEDIKWLSRGLPHMLITDLEQSKFIEVVGYQRLFDILKLLGKEDVERISASTATQVAKRAGVTTMLLGSIFKSGNKIRIDYEVQDVNYGKLICADKVIGEEPLALADELGNRIRLRLDIDPDRDPSKKVADVTTHSTEAYRFYLEGLDFESKLYRAEAKESYKKALEFDSTFAMAYYRLAFIEWLQVSRESTKLIAKAVEYSEKVSQKEKYYIKSLEARASRNFAQAAKELERLVERYPQEKEGFLLLGNTYHFYLRRPEKSIHAYHKAIEIDPLYKMVYNHLAYAYDTIGNFEKSIWAINKYISLAPDEPNPYDSRGELYARNGKIDQAIQSYKKASEIKPDLDFPLTKLGDVYLFKREYDKAEGCYQKLSSSSERRVRSSGKVGLALIPLSQGRFDKALEVLSQGIVADKMERAEGPENAYKYLLRAIIYQEKKNLTTALEEIEKALEIFRKTYSDGPTVEPYYVQLLAEKGDIAEAREVAKTLKKDFEEKDQTYEWAYWYAVGCIELAEGKLEESITDFEKATKTIQSFNANYSQVHLLLSRTYLESGRLGEAVTEFEEVLSKYVFARALSPILVVKAYYHLGLAYEKSGWNKKAIEQYEEFLEIWKDADPGIPEVEDAKERLKKLRVES